ncbi:MAG: hypothetical protein IPO43_08935 [Rhodoferax sp.]|nr:hypothetical protein [Rhodoferax sp.]
MGLSERAKPMRALDLLAFVVNAATAGRLHEAVELTRAVTDVVTRQMQAAHRRELCRELALYFNAQRVSQIGARPSAVQDYHGHCTPPEQSLLGSLLMNFDKGQGAAAATREDVDSWAKASATWPGQTRATMDRSTP